MSTQPTQSSEPLRVRENDRDVLLHAENDDLFMCTGEQIIRDRRLSISIEIWLQELDDMLGHVRSWIESHTDAVAACYASPLTTRVAVFVIPSGDQFNFDLATELAELNGTLVTKYNVGMIEIRQIPRDEVGRFVPSQGFRRIYGPDFTSH